VRRITDAERRARLGRRHGLAPEAHVADMVDAARSVVVLHATDPATVYLSTQARAPTVGPDDVARTLYDDRLLLRMLGMRRTLFIVPFDLIGVVQASSTDAIAAAERKRFVKMLVDAGIGDDRGRWLRKAERDTLAALRDRGSATAVQLGKDVPALREKIAVGEGKKWAGTIGVSGRLLVQLAAEGHIVRGRPRGSLVSSQYEWTPTENWFDRSPTPWNPDEARAELVRRWLSAFGPGTVSDLKWWTGWTLGQTRTALEAVDTVEVELEDGSPALVLAGDEDPVPAPEPWVALLPALDPTPMGWAGREWYLGEHRTALFDRSGNVGPTVWCDGRVVGGWTQHPDGEVVWRLLEDVGAEAEAAVATHAARVQAWLGDVRVTPRFRTPVERELSS
jgi:hypothetical protein